MASGARLPRPDPDKPKVRWITPNTIMIDIIKLRRARQAQCSPVVPLAASRRRMPASGPRGRSRARTGGAGGFPAGRVRRQQLDGFGLNR